MQQEKYLAVTLVAERLGCHRATVYRMAENPKIRFPHPIRLGNLSRWRLSEIEAWENDRAANRPTDTSDNASVVA